ncbi:MAG: hypothetical protein AB7O56_07515 [Bauldia sp.]
MGLLSRLLGKPQGIPGESDIVNFTTRLRNIDASEVGFIVAVATDVRHHLRAELQVDLLHPAASIFIRPDLGGLLFAQIKELQRAGTMMSLSAASGFMVWIHTVRSFTNIDLRPRGRELWVALARGFPHAEMAAIQHFRLAAMELNIDNFDQIPDGLGPLD